MSHELSAIGSLISISQALPRPDAAILSMEKTEGRMVQQMHPRGEKEQIQDERQT
jgi:hypothetical protein